MSELADTNPPGKLFRIGRRPDPWAWPPWEFCRRANRWDDPTDNFRVLYACGQRRGTFVETLARFRPDPAVVAGLAEITGADDGALSPGCVPVSWIENRAMGEAVVDGRFADIGHSTSLAYLRTAMAAQLIRFGIPDLDGAAIRLAIREFTQEISLHVFGRATPDGSPLFGGITYESRLGNEFTNWAIFERPDRNPVHDAVITDIAHDDPDLLAVIGVFNLELVRGR
jgi:hypothetical protein